MMKGLLYVTHQVHAELDRTPDLCTLNPAPLFHWAL